MKRPRKQWIAKIALTAILTGQLGVPLSYAAQSHVNDRDQGESNNKGRKFDTETPIKHIIVLIGENRTFDNVFGTYKPKDGQSVSNLLSKGIVNADGTPGPNKDAAKQFQIGTTNPASSLLTKAADTGTPASSNRSTFSVMARASL
jgi:phospholipase C